MSITKSVDIEKPELLEMLRQKVLQGSSAVDAMRYLISELGLDPKGRVFVMVYFRHAFGIDMRDIIFMTTWDFFDNQVTGEEAINVQITPILKEHAAKIKSGEIILVTD